MGRGDGRIGGRLEEGENVRFDVALDRFVQAALENVIPNPMWVVVSSLSAFELAQVLAVRFVLLRR